MQAWLLIGVTYSYRFLQNSLIGPFFVIDFSGNAASNKGMVT